MSALGQYYLSMAALNQAHAGMVAPLGQAQIGLQGSQAFLTNQQGRIVIPMARSQIAEQAARSGLYGAQTRGVDAETLQTPYNAQSRRNLEGAQGDAYEQNAREKWRDTVPGQTVDPEGNPIGPKFPSPPDRLSPPSPLIRGQSGAGMPAPPPVIGQTPSAAPPPVIGQTPSAAPPLGVGQTVSPSQALGYQGAPGAGVQSPFKGSGGPYNYSATPKYAEGVSSVGPALMGAPSPSFISAPPANEWSSAVAKGGNGRLLQGPNAEEMRSTYSRMGLPQDQIDARTAGAPTLRDHSVEGWKSMGYTDAEANYFGDLQHGVPGGPGPLPNAGMSVYDKREVVPQPRRDREGNMYASGTSHITAPGDGTVDTTKAKLANGEAVLNKGAAEHLGQPAIQALNAVGMLRMGMVPGQNAQAPQGGGAGYAKGTSKAGPKKATKGDAKPAAKDDKPAAKGKDAGAKPSDTPPLDQIDPKMLAAAMQMGLMGQQGGGMPPPGGAPQQMPQGGGMPMGML